MTQLKVCKDEHRLYILIEKRLCESNLFPPTKQDMYQSDKPNYPLIKILLESLQRDLQFFIDPPDGTKDHPATTCLELMLCHPNFSSGQNHASRYYYHHCFNLELVHNVCKWFIYVCQECIISTQIKAVLLMHCWCTATLAQVDRHACHLCNHRYTDICSPLSLYLCY